MIFKKIFRKREEKTDQGDLPEKDLLPKDKLFFEYHFSFEDGAEKDFRINLDPVTLKYLPENAVEGNEWTKLEYNQCDICSLKPGIYQHCPLAISIKELVNEFRDKFSYETTEITVYTDDRVYFKNTTMQKGLSSLMGIFMVSSGCPIMAKLRPMVRFHLPFATVLETTFRTTSTYLLGQFILQKNNKNFDFSLEKLIEIYKEVNRVNLCIAKRIRSVAGKDASINALVILDIFSLDIPLSIEDQFEELEPFFSFV